jgi:hypothetical protein
MFILPPQRYENEGGLSKKERTEEGGGNELTGDTETRRQEGAAEEQLFD